MKKLILGLVLVIPMSLAAQSKGFNNLSSKYESKEGYNCISLSGDLLKSIPGLMDSVAELELDEEAEAAAHISEKINDIESLNIIMTEAPSNAFRKDVEKMIKKGNYKSVVSINEENDKVRIYQSKKELDREDGKYKELVIIVSEPDEEIVISIVTKGDPMKMIEKLNI